MLLEAETFESYRPLLFSIAYRMLGSVMEAEDMVQETYLRYQKAQPDDIQSLKAYLTTIVTRLCLDQLKSAKTQRENYFGMWLPEPLLTEEAPSAVMSRHESISLAFLTLLEHLSPIERAVFILRNVFDYSYAEIAPIVGKSEANCRRYYHEAKKFLQERRPRFEPSSEEQEKLVASFIQAMATGDVDSLTEMLAEDVVIYGDGGGKVPAIRKPLVGREAVARFLVGIQRTIRLYLSREGEPDSVRVELAEVNGTPALLLWRLNGELGMAMGLMFEGSRITRIHNILSPDKLAHIQPDESRPSYANAPIMETGSDD